MMDDTATVTEAGFRTEIMNAYIVTQTANKFLQFNNTKCKTMKIENKNMNLLFINNLKLITGRQLMIEREISLWNILEIL